MHVVINNTPHSILTCTKRGKTPLVHLMNYSNLVFQTPKTSFMKKKQLVLSLVICFLITGSGMAQNTNCADCHSYNLPFTYIYKVAAQNMINYYDNCFGKTLGTVYQPQVYSTEAFSQLIANFKQTAPHYSGIRIYFGDTKSSKGSDSIFLIISPTDTNGINHRDNPHYNIWNTNTQLFTEIKSVDMQTDTASYGTYRKNNLDNIHKTKYECNTNSVFYSRDKIDTLIKELKLPCHPKSLLCGLEIQLMLYMPTETKYPDQLTMLFVFMQKDKTGTIINYEWDETRPAPHNMRDKALLLAGTPTGTDTGDPCPPGNNCSN